jgi:Brp/Blh family beta-carotene 15,15'-monooxygenase
MGVSTATPATARETLHAVAVRPAWAVHAALVVPFLLGVSVPLEVQYLPLAASVAVLGLPHGAVDHLALERSRGESPTHRGMALVGGLYALVGGAYLALWYVAPVASFVLFIAITWVHWGQGDVYALVAVEGADHLRTRGQRALAAVVRGGLPMLVPLLSYPGQYREVASLLVGRFGVTAADLAPLFGVETRLTIGTGFAVVTVVALALGARRGEGTADPGWRVDALETGLLWAYFLAVPPVLAIGVYFCLWHSVRHIARLALVDPGGARALERGAWRPALARFARDAAPLTLVSLLVLGAFYLLVPVRPTDLPETVGLYLVLIAVLTLPHVVVVSLMDRAEGVWSVPTA